MTYPCICLPWINFFIGYCFAYVCLIKLFYFFNKFNFFIRLPLSPLRMTLVTKDWNIQLLIFYNGRSPNRFRQDIWWSHFICRSFKELQSLVSNKIYIACMYEPLWNGKIFAAESLINLLHISWESYILLFHIIC